MFNPHVAIAWCRHQLREGKITEEKFRQAVDKIMDAEVAFLNLVEQQGSEAKQHVEQYLSTISLITKLLKQRAITSQQGYDQGKAAFDKLLSSLYDYLEHEQ